VKEHKDSLQKRSIDNYLAWVPVPTSFCIYRR